MNYIPDWFKSYGWTITDTFGTWGQWRKDMGLGPHRGIDFYHKGRYGEPIYSPVNGTAQTKRSNSYGNWLKVITPSGVEVRTAHHQELKINNGQKIKRGDIIALNGSTGDSTGPHVHLEVLVNGELQDPATFAFPPSDIGGESVELTNLIDLAPVPDEFSWPMPQVFNQGQFGTCTAIANCYRQEIVHGKPFSVAFTFSNRPKTANLGTYLNQEQSLVALRDFGAVERSQWPRYDYPTARDMVEDVWANWNDLAPKAGLHRIKAFAHIPTDDVDAIKNAIYQLGPVVVTIPETPWNMDCEGYLRPSSYKYVTGGHALCIIGWTIREGREWWIAVESRGPDHGDNGRMYIAIGEGNPRIEGSKTWFRTVWALADTMGGDRVDKLIVIYGEGDRPMGSLVEYVEKAPVIQLMNAPKTLLDSVQILFQVGGEKIECAAGEIIHLAGANRLETAEAVMRYLKGK